MRDRLRAVPLVAVTGHWSKYFVNLTYITDSVSLDLSSWLHHHSTVLHQTTATIPCHSLLTLTRHAKFTFSFLSPIPTGICLSSSLSTLPTSLHSHVSLPYSSADTKTQFSKLKLIYLLLISLSLICCPRDQFPSIYTSHMYFLPPYFYIYMGSISLPSITLLIQQKLHTTFSSQIVQVLINQWLSFLFKVPTVLWINVLFCWEQW